MKNILGIDFGTTYIGLAWMQEGLDLVLPFGRIAVGDKRVPDQLLELLKKEHIDEIVLGLPITLDDGSENANTKKVREFAEELTRLSSLPLIFVDERLTSFEADDMGGTVSRDERAAMVILQSYQSSGGMS